MHAHCHHFVFVAQPQCVLILLLNGRHLSMQSASLWSSLWRRLDVCISRRSWRERFCIRRGERAQKMSLRWQDGSSVGVVGQ